MSEKLTVAYIGNGRSTNRYHLPYILTRPDTFRVKSIVARSPSSWAPVDQVRYVTDIDEIWTDDEIDLVVVCITLTPSRNARPRCTQERQERARREALRRDLQRGPRTIRPGRRPKPLPPVLPKPPFDSDFLTVQKVLASGVLGDLLEMEMHFDYFRPEVPRERFPVVLTRLRRPVRSRRSHHRSGTEPVRQSGPGALRRAAAARAGPDE